MSVGCTTSRTSGSSYRVKSPCTITSRAAAHCNSCVPGANSLRQQGIGIDGIALPPRTIRAETCNREVQVRRILGRVAGTSDISEQLPARHGLVFGEPGDVVIEVRVVVRE